MSVSDTIEYSEIPVRAQEVLKSFLPDQDKIAARVAEFLDVEPRPFDEEGDQETLSDATFTHHFTDFLRRGVNVSLAPCGRVAAIVPPRATLLATSSRFI
jgi:hypothetical protein